MSAMAATDSRELSSAPSPASRRGIPLDEIAALARRRAAKLDTTMPVDVLVQHVLGRFDDAFGSTSRPVDLDGWLRRAMRDIVRADHYTRMQSHIGLGNQTQLVETLEGLAAPVRSPALAKQRRQLLRRVSELIAGPECRVVFAMISEPSMDRVAGRLNLSPIEVARLQRRGLAQLQERLDQDQELALQVRAASRQPRRARTSV